MATCGAAGSSGSAVCCPVCYREYSDSDSDLVPRILHCGHSYCTGNLSLLLTFVHVAFYCRMSASSTRCRGRS